MESFLLLVASLWLNDVYLYLKNPKRLRRFRGRKYEHVSWFVVYFGTSVNLDKLFKVLYTGP